ncbi:sulfite exporter TauE/SafE family protein [Marinobacterium sp. CAU 1594]|nr:sulfite exporter TauE/SafE family protein [Marinobacterium arenosum]
MLDNPLFYLTAIPAVLITGLSKGGFGGGLGLIAVPLISMAIAPVQAAAIMLPILCLMDLVALRRFRGKADWANLKILLPAALFGIGLGTLGFRYLSDSQIKLMIGLMALGFVANYLLRRGPLAPQTVSVWRGGVWGTLAGFTSFGVHAGGAPLNIYLLPQRLDKSLFVATTIVFFASVNFIKLVPYFLLGQFNSETLWSAAVLAPLAPVGVYAGSLLHHRIPENWFYRCCYGLLTLTGLKLVYDGVMG